MTTIIILIVCFIICWCKVLFDLDNIKTFNAVKDVCYLMIGVLCVATIFYLANK